MHEGSRAAALPISTSRFSCIGARAENQDALGYHLNEQFACFVISDGVGGQAGGALAARIAVDTVLAEFADQPAIDEAAIERYVSAAQVTILAQQRRMPEQESMSATLVALFIDRMANRARWAHVGDSRLYWFRDGRLAARTEDHSLAQRAMGGVAQESPAVSVRDNLLYRALGTHTAQHEPAISPSLTPNAGDAFLLCTDGLWHLLAESIVERSLQMATTAEEWLLLLRRAAEAKPQDGSDNYSGMGIWVG